MLALALLLFAVAASGAHAKLPLALGATPVPAACRATQPKADQVPIESPSPHTPPSLCTSLPQCLFQDDYVVGNGQAEAAAFECAAPQDGHVISQVSLSLPRARLDEVPLHSAVTLHVILQVSCTPAHSISHNGVPGLTCIVCVPERAACRPRLCHHR